VFDNLQPLDETEAQTKVNHLRFEDYYTERGPKLDELPPIPEELLKPSFPNARLAVPS
jgi:hypothetical protein